MATKKITFDDKEAVIPPGIRVNQVWDQDINEIKDAINKNADVQIIHEESINNIISSLNNRLVSIGTISASGLIITIPSGANWIYNGVSYKTNSVTTITETLCATGFFRKDILVCNQYNQIVLIKGTESETIVIRPNIPIGTIFITEMYINDSVIGEPAEPITNNDFIKKQEKAPFQVWNSGEINNTYLDDFYYGYLNFRAAVTNLKSIGTYTNAYLYSGKEILIKNSQSTDITIYHLTGDGFQFSFPNENNFILKPNEIIRFSLKILSPTEGILEYVGIIASTSFSVTQDDVPDGTTYKQYSATEKAKLTAITGTNTGDETASSIITKIGDGTKINSSYLPSYVDDVLEFANLAAFSGTGESGKIYVAIDSSKQYRWTGYAYLQITNGLIATSNDVPEGVSNLYFTTARVLATLLTGISFATSGAIVSTDSVLVAFGKIQKQITDALTSIVLKADIASPTFTGKVVLPSTTSIGTVTNTELSYVDGVTSSIQTQLNGKQSTLTNPVTGIGSNINTTTYALQDGTILYHSTKLFVPIGTVSTSGTTVTSVGTQFTSGMVGAKLIINGEWRIITAYTSATVVIVASAYSVNYSGIVAGSWGVYSKSFAAIDGPYRNVSYGTDGTKTVSTDENNNYNVTSLYALFNNLNPNLINLNSNLNLANSSKIVFAAPGENIEIGAKDIGLRRRASGLLEVYDGTTEGNFRDLRLRNLYIEVPKTSSGTYDFLTRNTSTGVVEKVNTNIALTGTPTAPTAAPGTNDNTIANTAFVQANDKNLGTSNLELSSDRSLDGILSASVGTYGLSLENLKHFKASSFQAGGKRAEFSLFPIEQPSKLFELFANQDANLEGSPFVDGLVDKLRLGFYEFSGNSSSIDIQGSIINYKSEDHFFSDFFGNNQFYITSGLFTLYKSASESGTFLGNILTSNRNYTLPDASGTLALLDSPTLTGTPTAPTAAPGTNDNTIANTAFVQAAKKYKTYIGILNQSSTSAPTVTVIDNELSSAIVWTYSSAGGYVGTLIGAFKNNKTSINFTNGQAGNGIYGAYRISDNAINITSSNSTTGIASDGLIWNATIEIRIYN